MSTTRSTARSLLAPCTTATLLDPNPENRYESTKALVAALDALGKEAAAKMRDAGAQFKVAKNRLAKIAIEGTQYGSISDLLTGPTALATSIDPVAAAKVAVDFAKTNDRLEIVGGAMGDTVLNADGIKALAALPSLDQLRATIVGLVQAPATKIARTVSEPGAQLARIFSAYALKEAA